MGRGPETSQFIGVPETLYFDNGYRVETEVVNTNEFRDVVPSPTSLHEAEHTVVAEVRSNPVIIATRIPGPGYNGMMRPTYPDAIVALAPHANGRDGTGWDRQIARMMRVDENVGISVARSYTDANRDKIMAVAQSLEANGTIGPREIKKAMAVKEEVVVYVKPPNGQVKEFKGFDPKLGNVMIEDEWIDLRHAA